MYAQLGSGKQLHFNGGERHPHRLSVFVSRAARRCPRDAGLVNDETKLELVFIIGLDDEKSMSMVTCRAAHGG